MNKVKKIEKNYCREVELSERDANGLRVRVQHYQYYEHEMGDKINEIIKTVNQLSEVLNKQSKK